MTPEQMDKLAAGDHLWSDVLQQKTLVIEVHPNRFLLRHQSGDNFMADRFLLATQYSPLPIIYGEGLEAVGE
jgi:hypothetical protein